MDQKAEHLEKSELLERIRSEYKLLEATLDQLSEDEMVQPGVEGEWSVKNVLVHLIGWEERLVRWIGEALRGEALDLPAGEEAVNQINAGMQEGYEDRPPTEVRAELQAVHQETVRAVEAAPEADLFRTGPFAAWGDPPLWQAISLLTWQHYAEHNQSICRWRENLTAA